jgi:glycosyltransferase involved in cell wall biosynthesis
MVYPKLSIITPNYNNGIYLEDTIKSVLNQNYPNLEYIIIDGGSTDNSLEIIKKYESSLKCWISEKDKGMYHAIQKGFELSSGEIMAWINSDDMYHKNSFFSVAEIFDSFPDVNWISGVSSFYDDQGRVVHVSQSRKFSRLDFLLGDFQWIQQESVFWRRKLWNQSGASFDLNLKYAGDFELWNRFFQHERLFVSSCLLGGFRWHNDGQITATHMTDYLNEVKAVCSKTLANDDERKIVNHYKRVTFIVNILNNLKIFRTEPFIARFKNKYFKPTPSISFNRNRSKFELKY